MWYLFLSFRITCNGLNAGFLCVEPECIGGVEKVTIVSFVSCFGSELCVFFIIDFITFSFGSSFRSSSKSSSFFLLQPLMVLVLLPFLCLLNLQEYFRLSRHLRSSGTFFLRRPNCPETIFDF